MDATIFFKDIYDKQENTSVSLKSFQDKNWNIFNELGLPAIKHEEWKYTRVRNLFKDGLIYNAEKSSIQKDDITAFCFQEQKIQTHWYL